MIENHDEKAAAFFDCFKKRMGVSNLLIYDFELSDIIQKCPGLEELSVPVTKEEIDHVIRIIHVNHASRPDDFNG